MTCALLAVVIAPVRAQNKTAWVDSADHSTQLPVKWVSSVLTSDWDEDGEADRAILYENPESESSDLYSFLYTPTPKIAPDLSKPQLVWRGQLWGKQPYLIAGPGKSFRIHSGNEAVGRDRWAQYVIVSYRKIGAKPDWWVTGFSWQHYDTLQPESVSEVCDLNLLTGRLKKEWQNTLL